MTDLYNGYNFGKFVYSSGRVVSSGLVKAYNYGGVLGATGAVLGVTAASPISTGLGILSTLYGVKQIYEGITKDGGANR